MIRTGRKVRNMGNLLLAGYYGFGNLGDEAILASTVSCLRAKDPDIDIRVLSKDPEETSRAYRVLAYDRMKPFHVISAIKDADLVVFGGGSLLQDSTSFRSLTYYVALLFAARALGKPLAVYANGVGPVRSHTGRLLIRKALSPAEMITVRDQESLRLLREIGLSNEVKLTADPAFLLSPSPSAAIDEMLKQHGISPDDKLVWLGLRPDTAPESFYRSVAQGVSLLRSTGFRPYQMIMQDRDTPMVGLLNEMLAECGQSPVQAISGLTPQDALGVLARGNLCIGMRLHTLILSAKAGIPFLGVEIDPKIGAFCRSLGFPVTPDPRKTTGKPLLDAIEKLIQDRPCLAESLKAQVPELVSMAQANIDMLLSLLDAGSPCG